MANAVHHTEDTERPVASVGVGEPGYGLGLAGFIVSFFVSVAGIVMSAVALSQSKAIGKKNGFALAGLIIGIVKTSLETLAVIGIIFGVAWFVHYCAQNQAECHDSGYMTQSTGSNDSSGPADRTY